MYSPTKRGNMRKSIRCIEQILKKSGFTEKVKVFPSTKAAGDDFDEFEENYVYTNLNPQTIKGHIREITPESSVYKQYGKYQAGMREILCDERWRSLFENCNKIEIDNIEYQTFKDANGNKTTIIGRPYSMIRVLVSRAG